jgi:1-acyl-sn-glycerol-3-phosphate acyltransferase
MNRYRMQSATGWWSPQLSARMIKLLRGIRLRKQKRDEGLQEVKVVGAERVRQLVADNHAVLITPNHSTHADAYSIYAAADEIGIPLYMMTAWQVFADKSLLGRQVLRWHGCFSVDREATDLRAFRQAVDILENRREPLVVFPEGEVYHCNARVRPFREGAVAIAMSAMKRSQRPVTCVPCGIWYEYIDSPEAALLRLMDDLEQEMFWRPRPDLPLHERIYRFAEVPLVIKELEFLGHAGSGPLPARMEVLADRILRNIETRRGIAPSSSKVPERVKELRHRTILALEQEHVDEETRRLCRDDLDDLFLTVQLYSYPGDYVAEEPTIERMAETLDKLEEDVLNRFSATVRGTRRAAVVFGQPITIERSTNRKTAIPQLTETLEQQVQLLVDGLRRKAEEVAKIA